MTDHPRDLVTALDDAHQADVARMTDQTPTTEALVLVRKDSGGVFPDGTTNHPAIDFDAPPVLTMTDQTPTTETISWRFAALIFLPGVIVGILLGLVLR